MWNDQLYRCVTKRPKDGVDARLIARALRLEPLKNVLVYAKGDRSFRRQRLETAPHDTANDVRHVRFGVFRRGLGRATCRFETNPVSFGFH